MSTIDTEAGSNVLADIGVWCSELPVWQQDALRRIVEQGEVTEGDVTELVLICKDAEGASIGDDEVVPKTRPLRREDSPTGVASGHEVTILSMAKVQGVNALSDSEELRCVPRGITVVFGYNGTGKSGYGRVLRRACRARTRGADILPNVFDKTGAIATASVEFTLALDGTEQAPVQWTDDGAAIDALGAVSYFDAQCAQAHVRERIDIAFTPYGLDVLPKLGAVCKAVQQRLDAERKSLQRNIPKFLGSPMASGGTTVGKLLSSLDANTDIEKLEQLASLDDAKKERLKSLSAQLATDPKNSVREVQNRARRISALRDNISAGMQALSNEHVEEIRSLANSHETKVAAALAAAKAAFSGETLPEIGEAVWRELWEAARRYSTVAYPDQAFPVVEGDDARCVLCQQPLSEEAQDRLQRFEAFVADATAKDAQAAKAALDAATETLGVLPLRNQREALEDLGIMDSALRARARAAVAGLLRRRRLLQRAQAQGDWDGLSLPKLENMDTDLAGIVGKLKAQATEAEKAIDEAGRKALEAELAELKSSEWLATVLGDVKEHVTRLSEITKLDACVGQTKTNKITAKSKALAKEHVTDQLRDAFAMEIRRMQQGVSRLNVELAADAGEYGSTYYRVRLLGASNTPIEYIASEGEHQCIALAGFLSELSTEHSRSAIVFDDPVTSLDHRWRECFARRLVEEAANRQVIVFTHEIAFLHDLITGAERNGVPVALRHLGMNQDVCGVVSDGLPWVAQKSLQRIVAMEKEVRAAQPDYDAHNDDAYEQSIHGLYGRLRATIERAVEEWLFSGAVVRHRDFISLRNLKLMTVVTDAHCGRLQKLYHRCCDITEAHDRAAMRSFGVPRPDEALGDIAELKAVIDEINALQKPLRKAR